MFVSCNIVCCSQPVMSNIDLEFREGMVHVTAYYSHFPSLDHNANMSIDALHTYCTIYTEMSVQIPSRYAISFNTNLPGSCRRRRRPPWERPIPRRCDHHRRHHPPGTCLPRRRYYS
jgi:hypothetical protein